MALYTCLFGWCFCCHLELKVGKLITKNVFPWLYLVTSNGWLKSADTITSKYVQVHNK